MNGGTESAFFKADEEFSAHSWRKEFNYTAAIDAFYDPFDIKAKEFAMKWAQRNDFEAAREGGGGIFSEFDRRFLWSTFGKKSDPDNGAILDSVWNKYFDSK